MGFKYILPVFAIVGFASIVITKITEKDPFIVFSILLSGSTVCLFFYYFFIFCTCKMVEKYIISNNEKN
jgi:hypothetical protein